METNNGKAVWEKLLQSTLKVFEGAPHVTHIILDLPQASDRIVFIRNQEQQKVWMTLIPKVLRLPSHADLRCHAHGVHVGQSMLAWVAKEPWMVTPDQLSQFYPPAAYLDLTWQAYTLEGVMIDDNT